MNKFKLALFAVIAAGAVGCGGAGGGAGDGGGTAGDAAIVERGSDDAVVVVDDGIQKHPFITRERSNDIKTLAASTLDLNDDGLLDIVKFQTERGYGNSYVEAFINNGDRTFSLDTKYFATVGHQYRPLMDGAKLADLNADGRLDFVSANDGCFGDHGRDDCLPPLMSKADGTYEVTTHPLLAKLGGGASNLVDFDNDGDMDILYFDHIVNGMWMEYVSAHVYENRSENGVAKFVEHKDIFNSPKNIYGHFTNSVAFIDLNGDGLMDFMWGGGKWDNGKWDVNGGDVVPGFAYNKGNFNFEIEADIWLGEKFETWSFYKNRIADYDGDGDMDIFVADGGLDVWTDGFAPGAKDAMLWNVDGKFFVDRGNENTWGFNGFTHQADTADINNDGHTDLVVGYGTTRYTYEHCLAEIGPHYTEQQTFRDMVRVMINDGTGSFTTTSHCTELQVITPEAEQRLGFDGNRWFDRAAATLILEDFDGDGNIDYFQGDLGYADDFIAWGNGKTIDFNNWYSFDGFTTADMQDY